MRPFVTGPLRRTLDYAWATAARELLPAVCPVCRAVPKPAAQTACDECAQQLERLPETRCITCGGALDSALARCAECLRMPERPWNHAVSAFRFSGLARQVIHRYKYSNETYLAPVLAAPMVQDWRAHGHGPVDVLVPVPLHWTKWLTRGYNQSEVLARLLGRELGAPTVSALRRRRRTRPQAMLDFDQRQDNMEGGFAAFAARTVSDRHVLLVDDVLTTGATLAAAATVLNRSGAKAVSIITAARG